MKALIWLMAFSLAFGWGLLMQTVIRSSWALLPAIAGGLLIGLIARAAADAAD